MKVYQSRLFARKVKKFSKNQKAELDSAIRNIISGKVKGNEKRGDLKTVIVLKFKIGKALYLLSYRHVGEGIELITVGSHENYYRDLKSYMKNR